jgi:hypothetical protein
MIEKFKIDIPKEKISKIYDKVKNYPWNLISDLPNWEHGTNLAYLKEICNYWINDFDWEIYEKKINSFQNFKTKVDGIDIHFIKEEGSGFNPKTLLLMHGWPGSFFEFIEIINQLAHPENYGGNKEEGMTVIAPSLPGFGFSGSPSKHMVQEKLPKY